MKISHKIVGLALAMVASAQVGSVLANTSQHGAVCHPAYGSDYQFTGHSGGGTHNEKSSWINVACAFSNDHGIGTPQWEVYVQEMNDTNDTINWAGCQGVIIGADGVSLGATSRPVTNGTGRFLFSLSMAAPDTWQNAYSIYCTLPGRTNTLQTSSIISARIF